jgi:plasmid stabilization system protein ParE
VKRYRVLWTRSAVFDLHEIIDFIEQDQPQAARTLAQRILAAARNLQHHPRRGKVVPELRQSGLMEYRQVLVGPYRIVYAAREAVEILAVIDGRRDLAEILHQRLLR